MNYYKAKSSTIKWDSITDLGTVLEDLEKYQDIITTIELSGNSIGYEAAKLLSEKLILLKNLDFANFRDIFVSRSLDLHFSLRVISESIKGFNIVSFDISDNALGQPGVKALADTLVSLESLRHLYIENCGLGPEGSELLGEVLLNSNLKLNTISINRNRLENKGAIGVSKYIHYSVQ